MKQIKVFNSSNTLLSKLVYERLRLAKLEYDLEIYFDLIPEGSSDAKRILIQMEPPAVLPGLYTKTTRRKFHQIVTMSPWRAERICEEDWCFQPVERPKITFDPDSERAVSIVLINEHKFSAVESARYSTRRILIKMLEESNLQLDLYGPQWNMKYSLEIRKRVAEVRKALAAHRLPSLREAFSQMLRSYSCYKGIADEKLLIMSRYKFALIIENDIESLTEKLFDAIFAGTIPFYLGPKLENFTELHQLCIQLPDNVDSAFDIICENLYLNHRELIKRIREFTSDPHSMTFVSQNQVANEIASNITRKFATRGS